MHDDWEGGSRQGVAWRRLITVLAVAAVAAGSWMAMRSDQGMQVETDRNPVAVPSGEPDVVLQPPVRAGAGWACPAEHPVRAFASGAYFPPEHPAVPDDTARPDGCFLSADWAESGGYELAPMPPNVLEVGSLYLVPTAAPSGEACGDVAAVVEFVVPCPGHLPVPGRASSCANSCLFYGESEQPGVVIEQRGFPLPVDWCDGCEAHVVVSAVRDRSPPELVSCGPEMASEARRGAAIGGFHDCGQAPEWLPGIAGFPHERHTLLVWEDGPVTNGPVTYAVSMHGHGAEIRSVLSSLRSGMLYVPPSVAPVSDLGDSGR